MSDRLVVPPPDAIRTQREATDPHANAWVSANAGSGKTFVLTRRVIRLLLSGAAPETILCLTYTKAAAAEMRHRVSQILGEWTQIEEQQLAQTIAELLGRPADATTLLRARQLFALALETPGGLKINTIHAFCESVLQRFPLEAGVPVNFAVVEEADRNAMILEAREAVLAEGLAGNAPFSPSARLLFSRLSDHQIEKAISGALALGRRIEPILADPQKAKANLFAHLGMRPDQSAASVLSQATTGMVVPPTDWPEIFAIAPPDDEKRRFEDKLAALDPSNPDPMGLIRAYLTSEGEVPKQFPKAQFFKANPTLAENLLAEAHRLAAVLDRYRAAEIAEQSAAIIDVLSAIIARYEAQKRARSWLDFDDLVVRTAALFVNAQYGGWVRYKLDAGIEHILVDESQDTNPEQWQVIRALADDFFDGEGTSRPKTLFAVGDPKQSIYSFQGAEPSLFLDTGREMGAKARRAHKLWRDLSLRTSFRTLSSILDGVDAVANRADVSPGLFAPTEGIRHESARTQEGGTISLWQPIVPPETIEFGDDWPLEPQENLASAPRQLAKKIARTIKFWVDTKAPLGPRGRAIVPEDVLILVQRRSAVFGEIVRALKEERIDSPGADRMAISAHIAVDDLLGLADVLLNPADDLTLAAILRSPLIGFTEDDLYTLAQPRAKDTSLWQALRASEAPAARAAYDELFALRQRLDLDRPYEFFAHVLYAQGGLKRFHARLGPEVDEVIAEFLDLALEHERSDQPSLTGFIAAMRKSDIVIKRDLVTQASGVRVMTVHGAKGLEAPIVILADATAKPSAIKDCIFIGPHAAPFLLYSPGSGHDCAEAAVLRDGIKTRAREEYWRNLYVAMTRAEDALIVAGCLARESKDSDKIEKALDGTWYGAIKSALVNDAESVFDPALAEDIMRYPRNAPLPAPIGQSDDQHPATERPLILDPVSPITTIETISPSLLGAPVSLSSGLEAHADRLFSAEDARDRGIALHALLQHLTRVPQARRADVALVAAQTFLPDRHELAEGVVADALAIIEDPDLGRIFGPDSRAEVTFVLDATRNSAPIRLAGRIDRLVVDEHGVTIVDFKSDAIAPACQADVPEPYKAQLGVYAKVARKLFPDHKIAAAILWTTPKKLMFLDPECLAQSSASIALV